ncbi:MAG: hypothetical protein WC081_01390 [Candidatus Ratteibacteria bacterium]|jgi:hypothetical protein
MKNGVLILAVIFLAIGITSCGKKSAPEEGLSPANAIQKYGGVMGKNYQRAKSFDVLLSLKHDITSFQTEQGRWPSSLQELVEKGYTKELPKPPEGMKFSYNSQNGSIRLE